MIVSASWGSVFSSAPSLLETPDFFCSTLVSIHWNQTQSKKKILITEIILIRTSLGFPQKTRNHSSKRGLNCLWECAYHHSLVSDRALSGKYLFLSFAMILNFLTPIPLILICLIFLTVLLYSTGNYIQHPMIKHNGKEYEKEYTHIYV